MTRRVAFLCFGEVASAFAPTLAERSADIPAYDVLIDKPGGIERLKVSRGPVREALVCRRLALHVTPGQVDELRPLVDGMEEASDSKDVAAFHRLNMTFHERLVEFTGNRELAVVYRHLVGNLRLFRQHTLAQERSLRESNSEHRWILERLSAADSVAAGQMMQEHIEASSERTRLAFRSQPTAARAPEAR